MKIHREAYKFDTVHPTNVRAFSFTHTVESESLESLMLQVNDEGRVIGGICRVAINECPSCGHCHESLSDEPDVVWDHEKGYNWKDYGYLPLT